MSNEKDAFLEIPLARLDRDFKMMERENPQVIKDVAYLAHAFNLAIETPSADREKLLTAFIADGLVIAKNAMMARLSTLTRQPRMGGVL